MRKFTVHSFHEKSSSPTTRQAALHKHLRTRRDAMTSDQVEAKIKDIPTLDQMHAKMRHHGPATPSKRPHGNGKKTSATST